MRKIAILVSAVIGICFYSIYLKCKEVEPGKVKNPPDANFQSERDASKKEYGPSNPYRPKEPFKRAHSTPSAKEAMKVRDEYIGAAVNEIISHPVNCQEIQDNEEAYQMLSALMAKQEKVSDIVESWDKDMILRQMKGDWDPKLERKIQNNLVGHITFDYPNKSTYEEIAEIWRKFPCSEATIYLLWNIGKRDYIKINYPQSWEAKQIAAFDVYNDYGPYSEETIAAYESLIDWGEEHNIPENRYYLMTYVRDEFPFANYGVLSTAYKYICANGIKQANAVNQPIPIQAVEMYRKDIALKRRMKERYPKYYEEQIKGIQSEPECHVLIKKYAPESYIDNSGIEWKKPK
jgi:hypothetical protein